jgi:hypothetical protein
MIDGVQIGTSRTLEERVDKALGYCRWLLMHGVTWTDEKNGNKTTGMICAEWMLHCLTGSFDQLHDFDKPYQVDGCDCIACRRERTRAAKSAKSGEVE